MRQWEIPVTEYDCYKPAKALPGALPDFVLTESKLIVSTARAILTSNASRESRKFMAAIVKPTQNFLLDHKSGVDLRLSTAFRSVLRDFSASARVGELAQGVAYAYWKSARGYHWIADFGPWVKYLKPAYDSKRSPDYVMFNAKLTRLMAMEVKGTSSADHHPQLLKALRQCKDAVSHPAFNGAYATVLALDTSGPNGGSGSLHLCDPASDDAFSDKVAHFVFCRSYASWFELIGDQEMADWCRSGEPLEARRDPPKIPQRSLWQNSESPLPRAIAAAFGRDPSAVFYGTHPLVLWCMADFNFFVQFTQARRSLDELLVWPDGSFVDNSEAPDESILEFPDGTFIRLTDGRPKSI